MKLTKDTTAVLTIELKGALKTPEYKGERELHSCYKRIRISNDVLDFWSSDSGKPYNINVNWNTLSKTKRILANAAYLADSHKYSFEFID